MYEEEEDVVDMAFSLSRQGVRNAGHALPQTGSHESSLYANGTQHQSNTSLSTSDRSRSDGAGEPVTPTWPQHDPAESSTLVASMNDDADGVETLEGEGSPVEDDVLRK